MDKVVLYALSGAFLWGLADLILKSLLKNSLAVPVIANGLAVLLMGIFLFLNEKPRIEKAELLLGFVFSIVVALGLFFFFLSAKNGRVWVASTVMSSKVLWSFLLLTLIAKEGYSTRELVAFLMVFSGILLLSFKEG